MLPLMILCLFHHPRVVLLQDQWLITRESLMTIVLKLMLMVYMLVLRLEDLGMNDNWTFLCDGLAVVGFILVMYLIRE